MKRYFLFPGMIISLFISLLGNVLRLRNDDLAFSLNSLLISFLNSLICWLVIQFFLNRRDHMGYMAKAVYSILICIVVSFVLFFAMQDSATTQQRIAAFPKGVAAAYFWLMMRGIIIGGFLFFIAYLLKKSSLTQTAKLENERLKKENLRAHLTLLKEQVNPHFLFNSLGTLQTMVRDDVPKRFIQKLADVYRYILSTRMSDLIELEKELDFSQSYLYILKERFEDGLLVNINIDKNHLKKLLPPFAIQMLVENAVKHNVIDIQLPLKINIYSSGENYLTVSNSLHKKRTTAYSNGTGLSNIANRYKLLAGMNISIAKSDCLFTVSIPLLEKS